MYRAMFLLLLMFIASVPVRWHLSAVCGRVMTVLPGAAQRCGLVSTGVISESSFE